MLLTRSSTNSFKQSGVGRELGVRCSSFSCASALFRDFLLTPAFNLQAYALHNCGLGSLSFLSVPGRPEDLGRSRALGVHSSASRHSYSLLHPQTPLSRPSTSTSRSRTRSKRLRPPRHSSFRSPGSPSVQSFSSRSSLVPQSRTNKAKVCKATQYSLSTCPGEREERRVPGCRLVSARARRLSDGCALSLSLSLAYRRRGSQLTRAETQLLLALAH